MILPIEMHSSVHLHSFTCAVSLEGMPAFYRLCKWVLPHCLTWGRWNLSKPLHFHRQGLLTGSSSKRSLPTEVQCEIQHYLLVTTQTVWKLRCISCVNTSSQLGLPSRAYHQKGFLLQRDHSHKHNRVDAKICLTGGRRVGEVNSAQLSQGDTSVL